jgi:hypothetical protein
MLEAANRLNQFQTRKASELQQQNKLLSAKKVKKFFRAMNPNIASLD